MPTGAVERSESGPVLVQSRLKAAIDEPGTRDKVPGFDPSAAPLETDDESGGTPIYQDADQRTLMESGSSTQVADPESNDRSRYRVHDRIVWPLIVGLMILTAVAVALVAMLLS